MRIVRVQIKNFRGIACADLQFPEHVVLVGDNNSGKSTVFEAIDLVLGPDRLSRQPVVDEHDFYAGQYIDRSGTPALIEVEVTVVGLNDEQARYFRDHLEWWDFASGQLLEGPPPKKTDASDVSNALRVRFTGCYDKEEDDFAGRTYFPSPRNEGGEYVPFRATDKRMCGFLFLRTLRTGSRALSLERGSLLDVILRLQDKRLTMWEELLEKLRLLPVAEKPEIGIDSILSSVQDAVRELVPSEWADNPHMRVSDLTREHLRRTLTVFMGTGAKREDGSEYAAPFQHQGTGTINTLVLALLSQIAESKQNVIFAMEEPETATPPYTQKRIIASVKAKSVQAMFTSHSPYVLEEFDPAHILVLRRDAGILKATPANYPPTVKPKSYRVEMRTRFCEALLARRVLIAEGRTEYEAWPAAARRLSDLHPEEFSSLEALGIAVINAQTDSQLIPLGEHFRSLGKQVFAVFDKQAPAQRGLIVEAIEHTYEAPENGFESVVVEHTAEGALRRFAKGLVSGGEWPSHLSACAPRDETTVQGVQDALLQYFKWSKGSAGAADLLAQCTKDEMPPFVVETIGDMRTVVLPSNSPESTDVESGEESSDEL